MSSDATAYTVPSFTSQAHSASASAGACDTERKYENTLKIKKKGTDYRTCLNDRDTN